jgi:serine/threonine protein kinase
MLLSGRQPFWAKGSKEKLRANLKCDITFSKRHWKRISKRGIDFVKHLISADPQSRLNYETAVSHPWTKEQLKKSTLRSQNVLDSPICVSSEREIERLTNIGKFILDKNSSFSQLFSEDLQENLGELIQLFLNEQERCNYEHGANC